MNARPVPEITLQANLCAGDLPYCDQTVPALIATHRPDVRETVVVVDCCRPQSTPFLNAHRQYPSSEFNERLLRLRSLAARWQTDGLVDRVVWLEADPSALATLNRRFCGVATSWSHDHLGHAFSAYFAGWDSARTRYVLHFDADIVFHQAPGFSWLRAAIAALAADKTCVAASPRIAPPDAAHGLVRQDAPGSGWQPSWPLEPVADGWRSVWFSTRCHLMDRERLERMLPLTPLAGAGAQRRSHILNTLLAPLYGLPSWRELLPRVAHRLAHAIPAFPLPPEVLLHEQAQSRGFHCLYLGDPRAWFLHPDTKPAAYLRLLPRLLERATRRGEFPEAQRGVSGVQFAAWEAFENPA